MRYIRYAFLGCLGIILVSVSMANRGMVAIKLIPDALGDLIGFNLGISLPLFVVILGGIAAGLVIGFVWEWLREYKLRRTASTSVWTVRKLEREVSKLKGEKNKGKDEVLAILEEAS
ncbi:MAG: LapA family protein [Rhodobacteraceae bacterium]|nr:LapA family protein [Paracoccaceae bacterium]